MKKSSDFFFSSYKNKNKRISKRKCPTSSLLSSLSLSTRCVHHHNFHIHSLILCVLVVDKWKKKKFNVEGKKIIWMKSFMLSQNWSEEEEKNKGIYGRKWTYNREEISHYLLFCLLKNPWIVPFIHERFLDVQLAVGILEGNH